MGTKFESINEMRIQNREKGIQIREKIRGVFATLRKAGFFARMNFLCCQSCAGYEISQTTKKGTKFVYFHQQDNTRLEEEGMLFLAYGINGEDVPDSDTAKVAEEIICALSVAGLRAIWGSDINKKIRVEI